MRYAFGAALPPQFKLASYARNVVLPPARLKPKAFIRPPYSPILTFKSNHVNSFWTHQFSPIHHPSSFQNEMTSLQNRHLCETQPIDPKSMRSFIDWVKQNLFKILSHKNISSVSFGEYIKRSNARPSVKRKLRKVNLLLKQRFIDEKSILPYTTIAKYCIREAFVKVENLLQHNGGLFEDKAPRLIQGASAEFINIVGPWIMAFQDHVKKTWNLNNFITFTSGLTGEKMGGWVDGKYPYVLENDISRWDSSVTRPLLELEAWIFNRFGAPRCVRDLVKQNIKTRGVTVHGILYGCDGTRKSGDPYTSVGNSLLNGLIHLWLFTNRGAKQLREVRNKVKMMVLGDDNISQSTLKYPRDHWVKGFADLGMTAKPIIRSTIEDAEFCSSRFVPFGNRYVLTPILGRVLAKFGSFVNPPKGANVKGILRGVVLGLWNSVCWVPLMKQLFSNILKETQGVKVIKYWRREWMTLVKGRLDSTPSSNVWLSKKYYSSLDPCEHYDFADWITGNHYKFVHQRVIEIDFPGPKSFYNSF